MKTLGGDDMKRKKILPPTFQKVIMRTDPKINEELKKQSLSTLTIYKNCKEPEITERINQLNQEWDTERVLEIHASLLILLSSYLGIKSSRFWFVLTGVVAAFMLQHALQGWCPALPLIRKYGVRTADEIYTELTALKILRGDFKGDCLSAEDAYAKAQK